MTEAEALALLIRNAKTRANTRSIDLLTLAEASEYLEKLYGSKKELARKIGASTETFRVYRLVKKLPSTAKPLVRSRLIDNPETIESILRIPNTEKQIELAEAIVSHRLNTNDTRAIEKFARYNPEKSMAECITRVLQSKPTVERRYVIVTELSEKTSQQLPPSPEVRKSRLLASIGNLGIQDIIACDLHNRTMILVLGEKGFSILKTKAKAAGASLEDMIDLTIARTGD
jgi:hypothetical protein